MMRGPGYIRPFERQHPYYVPGHHADEEKFRQALPDLTDDECMLLATVNWAGDRGINAPEISKLSHSRTWLDTKKVEHTKTYYAWGEDFKATEARFQTVMMSLLRFNLVAGEYNYPDYRRNAKGRVPQEGRGWIYWLTDAGRVAQQFYRAHVYDCCENSVHLFCVCTERTFCPEHGGGCHGTHD